MKALTCEMCGSTEIVRQDGLYVCQACGTKYSIEDAKKMMSDDTVSIKGTVKIDNSGELPNLIKLGESALEAGNPQEALSYANRILELDSSLYRGWFLKMQATSGLATLQDLHSQEIISLGLKTIEHASSDEEKIEVYNFWLFTFNGLMCFCIDQLYDNAYWQNCTEIYLSNKGAFGTGYAQDQCLANDEILNLICNQLNSLIGLRLAIPHETVAANEQVADNALAVSETWKFLQQAINGHFNIYDTSMSDEMLKFFVDAHKEMTRGIPESKLKTIEENPDESIQMDNKKGGNGCYVATAVYGSYDCPEVWTLRRFRDYTLDETWYGKLFIKVYYALSPTFVRWFGASKTFKWLFSKPLNALVSYLHKKGVASSPYIDKY